MGSKCMSFVAFLLAGLSLSLGQDIGVGPCPNPQVQKDFDIERFRGTWYQIERYQDDYMTVRTFRCNVVTYSVVDSKTVAVNNTYITTAVVDNVSVKSTPRVVWSAVNEDRKEKAKWVVDVASDPDTSYYGNAANLRMNYWILDTDYENNALVWTCTSNGEFFTQYAEILHRTDNMSEAVLTEIKTGLAPYKLRPDFFRAVLHNQLTDCDY